MNLIAKILTCLGGEFEVDEALYGQNDTGFPDDFLDDDGTFDDEPGTKLRKDSSNISQTKLIHLEDHYILPTTPKHLRLLKERKCRNTNHSSKTNLDIHRRPPVPIDALVTIKSHEHDPESSAAQERVVCKWTEPDEEDVDEMNSDHKDLDIFLEYPEFLSLIAEMPPEPESVVEKRPGRLKRIKRAIRRFFGFSEEKPAVTPATISPIFPSLMVDEVTTLHVLRGDEEAETGVCEPVARLRVRRANL